MTITYYPDRTVTSSSGRFTLAASSSSHWRKSLSEGDAKPGAGASTSERRKPPGFGYRLTEHVPGSLESRVVWERGPEEGESPPQRLWVSDDGWAVLRLQGFRPQFVAFAPSGREVIRVHILRADAEPDEQPGLAWRADNYRGLASGGSWARYAWACFHRSEGSRLFVFRTFMGQRLVLNLSGGVLEREDSLGWPALAQELDDVERGDVAAFLGEVTAQRVVLADEASQEDAESIVAALSLVGVHRIVPCVPYLRQWEEVDRPHLMERSLAFGDEGKTWLEWQTFRPVAQHSLRMLGQRPEGYATYHFLEGDDERRLPMREFSSGRRAEATALHENLSAAAVLNLLGAPDDVMTLERESDGTFHSTEEWVYDTLLPSGQWLTLKLTWESRGVQGQLVSVQEAPAVWSQVEDRVRRFFDR
ncbi:hypothetical protein MYSTI_02189 [Myxococcus stipitatus DSM 14675]|uniref:Uncharacterized protein n=1 Tax=Myxococcus stipitatus (strain DSM 14675 / JCM 12634 / Mx s8) TaxID=1278073 RepID=L7U422_MYXSD|nr:hypothetical protein [Myxococcus stipitatus]AGC43516.1 hypothetical protein MYSTI_02189 [Myxococcus stipitatus DSM 14675]